MKPEVIFNLDTGKEEIRYFKHCYTCRVCNEQIGDDNKNNADFNYMAHLAYKHMEFNEEARELINKSKSLK